MRVRHLFPVLSVVAMAACGEASQSGNNLEDAAAQSDPTSAAILENAARNGSDPQAALQEAGNASAPPASVVDDGVTTQARPNLPNSHNRKDGTRPPDTVTTPVP